MRMYFEMAFKNQIQGEIYFDGFSVEKDGKEYWLDLRGDFDFETSGNNYSGRFKGNADVENLTDEEVIDLSNEEICELLKDSKVYEVLVTDDEYYENSVLKAKLKICDKEENMIVLSYQ